MSRQVDRLIILTGDLESRYGKHDPLVCDLRTEIAKTPRMARQFEPVQTASNKAAAFDNMRSRIVRIGTNRPKKKYDQSSNFAGIEPT